MFEVSGLKNYQLIARIPSENIDSFLSCYTGRFQNQYFYIYAIQSDQMHNLDTQIILLDLEKLKNLTNQTLLKIVEIQENESFVFIVTEYFKGISLKEFALRQKDSKFDIGFVLDVSIAICKALVDLHSIDLFHGSINLANVMVDQELKSFRLNGFKFNVLFESFPNLFYSYHAVNWLAFYSPEQTGRINRPVDYRTDFYSLGVLIYCLLVGTPPFESKDPAQLIHDHIASAPTPPFQIDSKIPKIFSDLTLVLLAKNAEDRYQSASGLLADLKECQKQLQEKATIDPFILRKQDLKLFSSLTQKFYGRETELEILNSEFAKAKSGSLQLAFIAGAAGIGKTYLVREFSKHVLLQNGYYLTGKYDQLFQNQPYSALIQAFDKFIDIALTESDENFLFWKNRFIDSLSIFSEILLELFPRLEIIFGKKTRAIPLPPAENKNRIVLALGMLLDTVGTERHTLVITLDDLQWADTASLDLLYALMSDSKTRHLLIIGTYRSSEVDSTHPLQLTFEKIKNESYSPTFIFLQSFDQTIINQILTDILGEAPEKLHQLSNLVHRKTEGNPLYINQLIKTIYDEKILQYDVQTGWNIDFYRLNQIDVNETILQMIERRLQSLSPGILKTIQTAACIGNEFSLELLCDVLQKNTSQVSGSLLEAIKFGILVPPLSGSVQEPYSFLHDRIRESILGTIPTSQKEATFNRIGNILLSKSSSDESTAKKSIFEVLKYLNFSLSLVTQQEEIMRLVHLNLEAAKKASKATAYDSAVIYLTVAKDLLAKLESPQPGETFHIYHGLVENAYLAGNFEQAEKWFKLCIDHGARTDLEKAQVWATRVMACNSLSDWEQSITSGMEALKLLRYSININPSLFSFLWSFFKMNRKMKTMDEKTIHTLPKIENQRDSLIVYILYFMGDSAFHVMNTRPYLISYLVLRLLDFTLKKGNSVYGNANFLQYALIRTIISTDHKRTYDLGMMSLRMAEREGDQFILARMMVTFYGAVAPLVVPSRDFLYIHLKNYQLCLETGNIQYAANSASLKHTFMLLNGFPLKQTQKESFQFESFFKKKQNALPNQIAYSLRSFIDALTLGSITEETGISNYPPLLPNLIPMARFHYFLYLSFAAYLSGNKALALSETNKVRKIMSSGAGTAFMPRFFLTDTLIRTQLGSSHFLKRLFTRYLVKKNIEKLRPYSECNPTDYRHQYLFSKGAMLEFNGSVRSALAVYDQALSYANRSAHTHDEAMLHERIANLLIQQKMEHTAQLHLQKAKLLYEQWGAAFLVNRLQKRFSFLTSVEEPKIQSEALQNLSVVDVITVLKASQALAEEKDLESLLKKLLSFAIENAGADRAVLFLEGNSKPVFHQKIPGELSQKVCVPIVQYAKRTLLPALAKASEGFGIFGFDSYVLEEKPKSILCIPILKQSKLIATLYLENRMTQDTFSEKRIEIIKLLSVQASTFIENATLYTDLAHLNKELEKKVEQRTNELQTAVDNLSRSNKELDTVLNHLRNTQTLLIESSKMSALGEMAAGVAHEINNPLAIINLFSAELMDLVSADMPDKQEGLRLCHSIETTTDRIAKIISGLRAFSRDGSQDPFEKVSVHSIIRDVLSLCSEKLKSKKIQLIVPDIPSELTIQCRSVQISQVLVNLLNNAYDALLSVEKRWIRIDVIDDPHQLIIALSNNGPPIPSEFRAKIFQPFFTTKEVGKGTGLGLSISRGILESHNGQLVQDEKSEFTRFLMTFPKAMMV